MAGNNEIEDEHIYCTQTADEVDIEIFEKIKEHFGQLDKQSFIRKVLEQYDGDSEQLNAVRKSMYDYGKSRIEDFPAGHLTERRQRGKTGKPIGEKYAADVYYTYAFIEGIVSMSEFQREVMSKHKMRNQVTLCISNDSCEEHETEPDPNGCDFEEYFKNALSPVYEKLAEIQLTLRRELKIKQSETQSLQLENEKLRQELEACNLEKCRLADSESHLRTEIRFLNQKIKSYDDGNDAKTQIISEVRKLQKTHSSPSKHSQQKSIRHSEKHTSLQKHTSSDASCEEQDNAIDISQQNGTTTKPSSHTVSNHTSYSANKDAQMQNSPSVTYAMVVNSPQENKSCSESKQSHSYNAFTADSKQKSSTLNDVFTNQDRASEVDTDVAAKDNTPNSFKGYTFVRKKHTPSKRVLLANIKARDTTFEKFKEDIVSWCHNKNVNVFSIFLLANHSARRYPTFVICGNIDEKDYNNFWPDTISARDWIVRNETTNR